MIVIFTTTTNDHIVSFIGMFAMISMHKHIQIFNWHYLKLKKKNPQNLKVKYFKWLLVYRIRSVILYIATSITYAEMTMFMFFL